MGCVMASAIHMPLLLLTRPREDSEQLAAQLEQDGIRCLIDPMLEIVPLADAADRIRLALTATPPQALCITSRHALPVMASLDDCRALPLFAVGEQTIAAARALGFRRIHRSTLADAAALTGCLRRQLIPENGSLLYVSGTHIRVDIGAELKNEGIEVRRVIAYDAQASHGLADHTIQALKAGHITAVAFYSPRTVRIFETLALHAGLTDCFTGITACCLSDAIAREARQLPWKQRNTSRKPDESAMRDLLRHHAPGGQE